ncbi:MAG: glycoside hydrolase family 16 protein [bacterium]|nr:glycoside hydrolase family 16 protein [bacterium]
MLKINFISTIFVELVLISILLFSCSDSTGPGSREWNLVWQDEFNGSVGQLPDSTKWELQIGDGTLYGLPTGWGNNQLEYVTDRPANVSLDGNGNLAIIARKESYQSSAYTSARINTQNLFEKKYGRFEARMKLPWGQGLWPAFWMLGSNIDAVGWPNCGEIDIMEYRGQKTSRIHGSLHGPGYSGGQPVTDSYDLPNGRFDTEFHLFAVEWRENYIEFFVDDIRYQTVEKKDVPGEWVFDQPFFIIINLAVGGNYVGPPNESTVFPQTMLVDYIRVYEEIE